MRLSNERIKRLQALLKELGLDYNDEQTQKAGIAIMRFVIVKAQSKNLITKNMEIKNGTIIT